MSSEISKDVDPTAITENKVSALRDQSRWPWLSMRLEDVCDRSRGITYGIVKVGEFVPNGVPVIRGGDIRDGRIVCDDSKRVTEAVSDQFRRTVLRGGEIVLNLIAEPGHSAVVPVELAGHNVSRDVAVIPPIETISARFLDYYLKSPIAIRWLSSRLQGSVTQKINLGTLRELPVPLPKFSEQLAIAGLLGDLDDRINLLLETNATLEAIAQALFKSWFVDFDPVRAKRDGRAPEGMDEATAALFPDSFEDSELGGVPRGWQVHSLDSIATYLNGLALQKFPPESDHEFLPVVKIAQLRAGITTGADRASARLKPEYVVHDGDVLFSWSGSLEVEFWCGGDGALNQHLFKVTSSTTPKWFYYLATRHFLPGFREIAAHKATTMGHIQRKHLTEAKLALPPAHVLEELGAVIGPILDRRIQASLHARELTSLRDTLLPRLISGQLRLPETAEALDEALA